MTSIVKAKESDFELLADISKKTFIQSHGHSATKADIDVYTDRNFNPASCKKELGNSKNIYHFIYDNEKPAGYSKIILDSAISDIESKNITKMERLYLLEEFYGLQLGFELFKFNIELSEKESQTGIWLFVWKENKRAIHFYQKNGFIIVGSYDFKLTETHSNPNHLMFLRF